MARNLGFILLLFSLSVAGYSGWAWWQETNQTYVKPDLPVAIQPKPERKTVEESNAKPLYIKRPKQGDKIGELQIPRLERQLPIFEGDDNQELRKGVGHNENSVLPGESDLSVFGGHRETKFQGLGKVKKGDKIIAQTEAGIFEYKVDNLRVVKADDRTVIRSTYPEARIALITCYPFSPFGPSPQRYVVEAKLIK